MQNEIYKPVTKKPMIFKGVSPQARMSKGRKRLADMVSGSSQRLEKVWKEFDNGQKTSD